MEARVILEVWNQSSESRSGSSRQWRRESKSIFNMSNTYIGGSLIYGNGEQSIKLGYRKCEREHRNVMLHEWETGKQSQTGVMIWYPSLLFSFIFHINLILLAIFPAVELLYCFVGSVSRLYLCCFYFIPHLAGIWWVFSLSTELVHVIP